MRDSGPPNARIMLVGEAPDAEDVRLGVPFVGASGRLLDQLLHEAGILRTECYATTVIDRRPPENDITAFIPTRKKDITLDMIEYQGRRVAPCIKEGVERLEATINRVKPEVIIAFGNLALWALTGQSGIGKWAGSRMAINTGIMPNTKCRPVVFPTLHPKTLFRQPEYRPMVSRDLHRAAVATPADTPPDYRFITRPTYSQFYDWCITVEQQLAVNPLKLAVDIETRAGHIACIGIATSETEAICIPLMCVESSAGYWSEQDEYCVIRKIRQLLHHPNAQIVGQNFLYDAQYFYRWLHCTPNLVRDTMGSQQLLFPGMPKDLAYLSRMWCRWHVYWKDESKDWDPKVGEEQLWIYNCRDAVATYEIDTQQHKALIDRGQGDVLPMHQAKYWLALNIMLAGIRRDSERTVQFAQKLLEAMSEREAWFERVLGHSLNCQSPHQLKTLFYVDFKQKPVINRSTGSPTTDEEALATIARREPLLLPLVRRIQEHRSLRVFYGTFVSAEPSWDGRLRTQFNPFGPETFRASSSKDAFGSGMNMQNIPVGDGGNLPNIRELFIPDAGQAILEADLDRADLQVVVWEADDKGLKNMLRRGLDVHLYNARDLFQLPYSDDDIIEGTEACDFNKRKYRKFRQKAKAGVHAVNYGVQARTLAITLGISVQQAAHFITAWFAAHPGIRDWHARTASAVARTRYIENRFGYRRYYLGRTDDILSEALAWTPQSTVAETINRLWYKIATKAPWIHVMLQVHDSLVMQCPIKRIPEARDVLHKLAAEIIIPYDDPLSIPIGIKTSTTSWGAAK